MVFPLVMECQECGTSLRLEAHQNRVCFDCWMDLDYQQHLIELQKKTSDEEE